MKKNLILILLVLCTSLISRAQQKTITGQVLDDVGASVIGVAVVEKGTTNGTVTNVNGNYSITLSASDATLQFSFIGMKTQELAVGNLTELNVTMETDVIGLEEVVAIGYGTATKKDLTGSVSSVKVENSPIASLPNINVLQSLQGSTPGVNVGAVSSAGGNPSLLVRGLNSISGSNSPLIVLDGVIYNGSLSEISNDDISSFDILKDASAAAIYGSRSSNGVIIITTKRGKSDKPVISFNTYLGVQSWSRVPEMKMGEEFIEWRKYNLGLTGVEDLSIENVLGEKELEAYKAGHQMDWFDEVKQFAPIQNYQTSISGSTDKVNYYVSGSYMNQKGVLDDDNFKKFSVTAKIENDITDWLSYGVNMYFNTRDYTGKPPQMYMATWYTPYSYKWVDGYDNVLQRFPTSGFLYNPYWGQPQFGEAGYYDDDLDKHWSARGTGFVNVKIPYVKGLSYRLNITGNKSVSQTGFFHHEMGEVNTWIPAEIENPSKFLNKAYGWKQQGVGSSWLIDNLINYKKSFGDHSVDALLGYTRDYSVSESVRFGSSDFSGAGTSVLGYNGIYLGNSQNRNGSTPYSEFSNIGYIGRLNYSYLGKYHLTANFRRDGYSAFAEGHKFGNFPGASAAWTISEERFMKEALPKLDYLKLRASYGKNGNQGISPYQTMANVGTGTTIFGSQSFTYSYPSSLSNQALTWETTTALNFGINYAFLNNRISGDIDIYSSKTTDQLLTRMLPIMTGYSSVRTNIGQVDNKGFELSLKTINIQKKDFKWETGINFWLNRNKLVSLTGLDADGDGVEDDDIGSRWFIGKSLGAIYDFTVDGIVQTEDAEYIKTYGISPGDLKIADIDGYDEEGNLTGKADGKITSADRSVIGYSMPNYNANISNTFTYKNLQLYFDINIITGGGKDNYYMAGNKNAYLALIPTTGNWIAGREYWTPQQQSNEVPRPNYSNPFGYGFYQTRSFARLQDLTFSYSFDKNIKEALNVRDLKVFVSGKNLFTLTDWIGLDPENAGQIGSSNPVIRTVSVGANLSF